MDAELVLEAGADHVVARAERAVLVDEILGHQEQRDAARAGRRIGQAGQHQMDDVVGHLVVAVGDEDLGAEDAIGAVGLLHGARLERAEVGAGVRLGQVHGAGPLARHHLRQVGRLQLVAALRLERVDGAEGQQRAQGRTPGWPRSRSRRPRWRRPAAGSARPIPRAPRSAPQPPSANCL